MLPKRLRPSSTALDRTTDGIHAKGGHGLVIVMLVALALGLAATNVLTLVDGGIHAKAYALIETVARVAGIETSLANSPTEVNRRVVEVAARQSAEAAIRQQSAATMALVANSLVLVDATNALVREHSMLRQTHLALAETSKVVSRRVAIRTAAGATRSVTTLAGKALPYLGVASILALTAYDLADACQTLKDANELTIVAGAVKGSEEGTICRLHVPSIDQVIAWSRGRLH